MADSEHPDASGPDDDNAVGTGISHDDRAVPDASVLAELYREHSLHLVRLAAMLLGDRHAAEDAVQDAFAALHRRKLADPDRAVGYLRVSVLNAARTMLRHRRTARKYPPSPPPPQDSAEQHTLDRMRDESVRTAVTRLPRRQRDVILLRYLEDLTVAETARTLRITRGAVKSSATRAMSSLAGMLGDAS